MFRRLVGLGPFVKTRNDSMRITSSFRLQCRGFAESGGGDSVPFAKLSRGERGRESEPQSLPAPQVLLPATLPLLLPLRVPQTPPPPLPQSPPTLALPQSPEGARLRLQSPGPPGLCGPPARRRRRPSRPGESIFLAFPSLSLVGRTCQDAPPNRCVGVFGMSLYTNERDLEDFFAKWGHIDKVQLVYDHPVQLFSTFNWTGWSMKRI